MTHFLSVTYVNYVFPPNSVRQEVDQTFYGTHDNNSFTLLLYTGVLIRYPLIIIMNLIFHKFHVILEVRESIQYASCITLKVG